MSKRLLAAACVAIASHAHADSPPLPPSNTAIEFYHQGFDHYFITSLLGRDRRAGRGQAHGLVENRPRFLDIRGAAAGSRERGAGVPLLHSAGARRLALLLGVRRRVRRDPRQDRRRSQLQRLHRGDAQRLLRAAARSRDRRVSPVDGAHLPPVEPARGLQSPLHDRPRHQGVHAVEELRGGRLRSRCGGDVHHAGAARRRARAHVGNVDVHARLPGGAERRHRVRQRRGRAVDRGQSRKSRTT